MNKILEFLKSFIGLAVFLVVNELIAFELSTANTQTKFILTACLGEIILLAILILIFRKRLKKDFIDFDKNYQKYLSFGFKAWFAGLVVMSISNNIIYRFMDIPANQQANELILSNFPIYAVISIVVCGPFIEEMVFRLSFKEHIKNKYVFLILTTLIFAGIHIIPSMKSPIELLYLIPYGALALSFGITVQKTDNIFTTVLIHTFHNTMAVVLLAISTILGV